MISISMVLVMRNEPEKDLWKSLLKIFIKGTKDEIKHFYLGFVNNSVLWPEDIVSQIELHGCFHLVQERSVHEITKERETGGTQGQQKVELAPMTWTETYKNKTGTELWLSEVHSENLTHSSDSQSINIFTFIYHIHFKNMFQWQSSGL